MNPHLPLNLHSINRLHGLHLHPKGCLLYLANLHPQSCLHCLSVCLTVGRNLRCRIVGGHHIQLHHQVYPPLLSLQLKGRHLSHTETGRVAAALFLIWSAFLGCEQQVMNHSTILWNTKMIPNQRVNTIQ